MKVIALLPMKGNSERIPNKNLKIFGGLPLYHTVLNKLLDSTLIDQIVINTDSSKIIDDINKCFKSSVKIRIRKESLRGDYVSMNKIIDDDINDLDSSIFMQTHSTNPLIKTETFDMAIKKMKHFISNNTYDSIFSVLKTQKRFYNKKAKAFNHDPRMLVTQHLEPLFEENSCFYLFTKSSFRKTKSRIGLNPFMYEMSKLESIDIDYPEDFILAENVFKNYKL